MALSLRGSTGPPGLEPGELPSGLGGTEMYRLGIDDLSESSANYQRPADKTGAPGGGAVKEEGEEAMDIEEDEEVGGAFAASGEGEWGSRVGGGPRDGQDGASQPVSGASVGRAEGSLQTSKVVTPASKVVAQLTKPSGPEQLTMLLTFCPSLEILRQLVDAKVPRLDALQISVAFNALTKLVGARGTGLEQDGRVIARLLVNPEP